MNHRKEEILRSIPSLTKPGIPQYGVVKSKISLTFKEK